MTEPTLTANAGGTPLLNPLIAQFRTSLEMLLADLDGLDDAEYRWAAVPGAADLVDDGTGALRAARDDGQPTRTIAWTLAHLTDGLLTRADYVDGDHSRAMGYHPFPATAAGAVAALTAAAARWRAAVAGASADQAVQVGYSAYPVGMDPDLPFVDIVWWVNRELIAHGADITLMRELYAAR